MSNHVNQEDFVRVDFETSETVELMIDTYAKQFNLVATILHQDPSTTIATFAGSIDDLEDFKEFMK